MFRDELIEQTEALFEMSNVLTKYTGLSTSIWISAKRGNHGARIKIYKERNGSGSSFYVTISDEPKVIGNSFLKSKELIKIKKFVLLNKEILLKFWELKIEDPVEVITNLEKV